ncbi:TonB-dependent receptor-like protein [Blastomonas natatoria]|uniref:TonB-dependent receptor-like protein n=1 Tax=Blastomonas natatoria TaxID=34015 RepID=A0A2V3V9Z1_9SPHN|nr:TonB-dependent receptor [Blastomonas natatoria]PXW78603.1 TonB-dependent receptor-like protein [Blastomonas natatoria]
MKTQFKLSLLGTTLLIGAASLATPAFAQDQEQDTGAPSNDATIVVTGSLISNPNVVASSPVNVTTAEEIELLQANVAEEILREIPGVVPALGSAVNNGANGTNTVNLRGLGANRNLVLLDGNRLVPANFGGSVDLNNIPLALIERVDVLTGGASTTYGADAISGVVNFVTKRDFAGVEMSASNRITEEGDGNALRADLTVGANFDDGRGNAVLSIGYQEVDPVYQGARPISLFQVSSTSGVASGNSPTSIPTSFAFDNAAIPVDPVFGLTQTNPAGDAIVPFYAGFNFNPFNIFQTPFERFNMFGQAHYEISDSVEVYTRGLFSKNTVSAIIAPSGVFGETLTVGLNNPFLTPSIRSTLCIEGGIAAAACTPTSTATVTIPGVYRRTVEVGPRISEYVTQVFDYRLGVKVGVTDTIKLDVSGSYGESENRETRQNYVLRSRLQQALTLNAAGTACANPAGGCVPLNLFGAAGSITPAQAAFIRGSSTVTNKASLAQARALLAGDFGFSIPSASQPISFAIGGEYREYTAAREPDNLAAVPGELGGAGGAILPLDGGYNVYDAFGELNVPIASDQPFFHDLSLEAGVRYSKYEVDTAGSPSFSATTYKIGGSWAPVEALRFRGSFQRAVRAPNIGELFAPVVTGLDNLSVDPCAGTGVIGNALLSAVCIAQGAPAGRVAAGTIPQPAAGQANVTGGGNPLIGPEKAETYALGFVFQPTTFLSGLTVSMDYYNIVVDNAITNATPGDIIQGCFGSLTAASATSPACTGIRRNPTTGALSGSTANTFGLPQPLTNLGRLSTDGIDLSINYRTDLGFATLGWAFNGNWTNTSKFRASPTAFNRDCVGYYSVNCQSIQPEFSFSQRTTLGFGDVDVSLLWRYIDSVQYEGQAPDALTGRGFTNANRNLFRGTVTGAGPMVGRQVDFNRIRAYHYFDLSTRFSITDNLGLTMTVLNLTNQKAPLVGNTAGATAFNSGNTYPSTYDALGRTFAVSAKLKF